MKYVIDSPTFFCQQSMNNCTKYNIRRLLRWEIFQRFKPEVGSIFALKSNSCEAQNSFT